MIQLTLNIVPLSDLCELCGKQVVELTRELLLQLHYECLWKLIRVGELSAEDSEDRLDQPSIPIGFLRTPTQLRKAIQKGGACSHDTTLPSKIRGIRNLTLTLLTRRNNLQEGQCGHFVLEPEDNGRAPSGIARCAKCLSQGVGGRSSRSQPFQTHADLGRTQSYSEYDCEPHASGVGSIVGKGQLGRCTISVESRTDEHPAGCTAVPGYTRSA